MTYMQALYTIMHLGADDANMRTGQVTRRAFGLCVDYRDGGIFTSRRVDPGISAAEAAWMLLGLQSTDWLKRHCKIWEKFEDVPGSIENAYGYRWRYHFKRDQIDEALALLRKDPSSRQALVLAWDPAVDGLANQGQVKNVACPFAFQLLVCNGHLRVIVYQRSADFVAGVPYDLMTYWIIGNGFALELGFPFWGVQVLFGDAHIYHSHIEVAGKTLAARAQKGGTLGDSSLTQIMSNADAFVAGLKGRWDGRFAVEEKVMVAQ